MCLKHKKAFELYEDIRNHIGNQGAGFSKAYDKLKRYEQHHKQREVVPEGCPFLLEQMAADYQMKEQLKAEYANSGKTLRSA